MSVFFFKKKKNHIQIYHHYFLFRAPNESTSEEFFTKKKSLQKASQCSLILVVTELHELITASINLFCPPLSSSPPVNSHFLLVLPAAGQLAFLAQEVE